jgi:hypothetical protein
MGLRAAVLELHRLLAGGQDRDLEPVVGGRDGADPTYDATQHLLNCFARLLRDPAGTIDRFADLLHVDAGRVRRWLFARAAAETRDDSDEDWPALARALRPQS